MGRHVSSGRRRSLRGRLFVALIAILLLMGAAGFAAYAIWDHQTRHHPPARHSRTPVSAPATLAVTVTGPECQVFVRVPGGDILVNRNLAHGESLRFDDQRLTVVLSDGSAVRVYVNGKPRPASDGREEFTAVKQ